MSYLVLARKSRPQTFDQVVGQRAVVRTLQNSIKRNRVAHAILFSGVRGVGKTTLARIMAKALNCTGETEAPPCDQCPSCREIAAGNALDLYEIDGASNRGIQEIRELKEKIRFLPTSSRFKVIIIDEVHMLTMEAFNALLKTLEEPPAHVHFMFATTEIHKIPVTILSRCQQYELKRISSNELQAHFSKLAQAEGFEIEPEALSLICREAGGSVRDGLSLLDQMFSFGEQRITVSDVVEVLGLVDRELLLSICKGLLEGDSASTLQGLSQIFSAGMDTKRFLEDLMGTFRNLLLLRIDGCQPLIDLPEDDQKSLRELAANHSHESLHLCLTLLIQIADELRHTQQPRLAIETGFLKIIETSNVVPVSRLLGKVDQLLHNLPEHVDTAPTTPVQPAQSEQPDQPSVEPRRQSASRSETPEKKIQHSSEKVAKNPENRSDSTQNSKHPDPPIPPEQTTGQAAEHGDETVADSPDKHTKQPEPEPPGPKKVEQQPATAPAPKPRSKGKTGKMDVRRDWQNFILYVRERTLWMAPVLERATKVQEDPQGELHLHYDDPARCALLRHDKNLSLLTEYTNDFFQKPLKICFIIPESNGEGPQCSADGARKMRQQLEDDPLVQMATEIFNGEIGDIRIGPRSR